MKCEWKTVKLYEVCHIRYGKDHKSLGEGIVPVYGTGGIMRFADKSIHNKKSVLIPRKGTLNNLYIVDPPFWTVDTLFWTDIDETKILPEYLFYILKTMNLASKNVGTAVPSLTTSLLNELEINLPDLCIQNKIANILRSLDDKIELNNKINENLEQQALALYQNIFVNNTNDERLYCRADEFFDISIGKTPPRKEPKWFSHNPNDINWVSISDMGSSGLFISKSSEQLTNDAVNLHNIKIVPDNTVILSFKLTVGRVAITNGEMTTNEAIAHFKTDNNSITEYLYCYLKNFNYQTMGSTSSIATAVNSKIIKAMPFIIPTDEELKSFHRIVYPMFSKIKENQIENEKLIQLRDTLLPKLMKGDITLK